MKVAENCVVAIHYTLTDSEGEQLDSSVGKPPLVYFHGKGNIIPGLESALEGKEAGDEFSVEVQPEQAYGPRHPDMIQEIPRSAFANWDAPPMPGMQFQVRSPEGQSFLLTISKIKDDTVEVDGNHPLAGKVLHFQVSVVDVREATPEEILQGHL